ncbi:hypothetical protein YC2023_094050 [Brassica napus]
MKKKIRVHVIPHDPFRSISQKVQSHKDPSREARKFKDLKNLVPIPFRDRPLRTRSADVSRKRRKITQETLQSHLIVTHHLKLFKIVPLLT